jgi:hypothetical protein
MEWARERFAQPAVVSADIELRDCIDLLDIGWADWLQDAYEQFEEARKTQNIPPPTQVAGRRELDREVLNLLVHVLETEGRTVSSVRSAFTEGTPVFPGSAILSRSHVQIAVRDANILSRLRIEAL